MNGILNINTILKNIDPVLSKEEYVFCTFENATYGEFAELSPIAAYAETEGLTLVISKAAAIANDIHFETTFKAITLRVHSSLNAVGLTAAVSGLLAEHGISANILAAFYHDHVFVQSAKAEQALKLLKELQSR